MTSSHITYFLARPLIQFKYSNALADYLEKNYSTSLLASLSALPASTVDIRVLPENAAPFFVKTVQFRYELRYHRVPDHFTADFLSRIEAVFKNTNRLEPFVCFLGKITNDFLDVPTLKMQFFLADEDIIGHIAQAELNEIFVVLDFQANFKKPANIYSTCELRGCKLIVMRPDSPFEADADDLIEFHCLYYAQPQKPNAAITGMLLQLQNSVAAQAARQLAEAVQKATFTASTYTSIKNMLFTKKPDGFGQYSKDQINLYAGDLLLICQQPHLAAPYYETAQRSRDDTICALAGEKICRVHLIQALYTKQFEIFSHYSAWLLQTLRNDSINAILRRRAVVFLFLAARDCDTYNELAGKMLIMHRPSLQGAHCYLHAYNYYVRFGQKFLHYLFHSARLYYQSYEWQLSSAICQDLLRKLVRLKPYESGKQAALALQAAAYNALSNAEKSGQAYAQLAGVGQRRPVFFDFPDNTKRNVYQALRNTCVRFQKVEIIVNNLSRQLEDYSAVAGGSYHVTDMNALVTKHPQNVWRAAKATQALIAGEQVGEVDPFKDLYQYRANALYFGIDVVPLGIDAYLSSERFCRSQQEIAINNGLFGSEVPLEAVEISKQDVVKIIVELENLMQYGTFVFDYAELVSQFEKLRLDGTFRVLNGARFALVFQCNVEESAHYTELVLGFQDIRISVDVDVALECVEGEKKIALELKQQVKAGQICTGTISCGNALISCSHMQHIHFCDAAPALSGECSTSKLQDYIWAIFNESNTKINELLAEKAIQRSDLTRQILTKFQYQLLTKSRNTSDLRFFSCRGQTSVQFVFGSAGQYSIKFYVFAGGRLRLVNWSVTVSATQLPKPQIAYHSLNGSQYQMFLYTRNSERSEFYMMLANECVYFKNGVGTLGFKTEPCEERSLHRNLFDYYWDIFYEKVRSFLILQIDEKMKTYQAKQFIESRELKQQQEAMALRVSDDLRIFEQLYNKYFYYRAATQPYVLYQKTQQFVSFQLKTIKINNENGLLFSSTRTADTITIFVRNMRPCCVLVHIAIEEGADCMVSGVAVFDAELAGNSVFERQVQYVGACTASRVAYTYDTDVQLTQHIV